MPNYVTRKVVGTVATVKVYYPIEDLVTETKIILPRKIPPDNKPEVFKSAVKYFKDTQTLVLSVIEYSITEKLYGITMEQFMEKAIELDMTTRKPI